MAFRLFSRRFIAVQGLQSSTTPVVVPEGHTYVIKQLTTYASPLFAPARSDFRDIDSGATLFATGVSQNAPGWQGFYGALVFEAGQSFQWQAHVEATDAIDVYAGGYDLLLP